LDGIPTRNVFLIAIDVIIPTRYMFSTLPMAVDVQNANIRGREN
jgi:hypothetical protein